MEMEKVDLATEGNNHFGIKCHDWEGEEIYMQMMMRKTNVFESIKK